MKKINCAAGIISHNNKILLLLHPNHNWCLPGGKIELHEKPDQAVDRELLEEIGVKVLRKKIILITQSTDIKIYVYIIEEYETATKSEEHITLWADIKELSDYKSYKTNFAIYEHLKKIEIKSSQATIAVTATYDDW